MSSKGLTLIELVLSLIFVSVIVLAALAFEIFSRQALRSSERRAHVLNEATFVLEHMRRSALLAIGDGTIAFDGTPSPAPLTLTQPFRICSSQTCGNTMLLIKQDTNGNGMRDPDGIDRIVGYALDADTGEVYFCGDVVANNFCRDSDGREVLSDNGLDLAFSWQAPPDNQASATRINVFLSLCFARNLVGTAQDTWETNPHVAVSTSLRATLASEN